MCQAYAKHGSFRDRRGRHSLPTYKPATRNSHNQALPQPPVFERCSSRPSAVTSCRRGGDQNYFSKAKRKDAAYMLHDGCARVMKPRHEVKRAMLSSLRGSPNCRFCPRKQDQECAGPLRDGIMCGLSTTAAPPMVRLASHL